MIRRSQVASFLVPTLIVAFVLRWSATGGSLWLDEIWSLEMAQRISSPREILTAIHHDNNHPLNTLVLWLIGSDRSAATYRLPAAVAGTLTVALAWVVASRWGRVTAITMATMTATSCLFVHYSSEARGYAFLLLFVLAALESLLRYMAQPSARWAAVFGTSCALGFLSHPTFLHFWLASACWSLLVMMERLPGVSAGRDLASDRPSPARSSRPLPPSRERLSWLTGFCHLAVCHLAPFITAVWLWRIQWSRWELGGGPKYSLIEQLTSAASWSIGGPGSGVAAAIAAVVAVSLVVVGLYVMSDRQIARLLIWCLLLPVGLAVATRPPFLFVRYFLVAVPCCLLSIAVGLGQVYRWRPVGRWCFAVILGVFLTANTLHTLELVRLGRGQYGAALEFIAAQEKAQEKGQEKGAGEITLSSDHNFGIGKLVQFYAARLQPPARFVYVPGQSWPVEGPRWLILHREGDDRRAPDESLQIDGHRFELARVFDCAPLSGWRWLCYRRHAARRSAS